MHIKELNCSKLEYHCENTDMFMILNIDWLQLSYSWSHKLASSYWDRGHLKAFRYTVVPLPFRPPWVRIQYAVFPHDFPKFPEHFHTILSIYPNSNTCLGITIYQNELISFAFERACHGL